jgi:hypothetical protein
VFHGGAYDWLTISGFATIDLRDIYLTLAVFTLFHSTIHVQSWNKIKKEFSDPFGLNYIKHEYANFKRWLKRKKKII